MTLKQLRYFLSVCETGSTAQAAEKLYVSQSTLSLSLKRLEEDLGTELFWRTSKGMELTEAGKVLSAHAQGILSQVENVEKSIRTLSENAGEALTLGAPSMLGATVLPGLFRYVVRRSPNITLHSVSGSRAEVMRLLGEDKVDFVLLHTIATENLSTNYHQIFLCPAPPLHFCISEANPLAQQTEPPYEALFSLPLVQLKDSGQGHIFRLYQEFGLSPNFLYSCDQLSSAVQIIQQGLAAGFFNDPSLLHAPGIRTIPIAFFENTNYYILYKKSIHLAPTKKRFLKILEDITWDKIISSS